MIQAWWQRLQRRERHTLVAGAGVVVLVLAWAFIWHPLARARNNMAADVNRQRADIAWMRQAIGRVHLVKARGQRGRVSRQGKSLLALADVTARGAGLGQALKSVEPTSASSVRVTFEIANFDALANWLDALARDYGVQVSDLSVDKVSGIGLVNARVTLQDAQQ